MQKKFDFTEKIVTIDESFREMASLDELYNELLGSAAKDDKELMVKKEEAKFARDRILKLSLHVKNLVANLESDETLT